MDVDMSLDDMIATKPRGGGRRGGGGRAPRGAGGRSSTGRTAGGGAANGGGARERYAQGAVPVAQTVQARQAQAATAIQSGVRHGGYNDPASKAVKIIVSNLPLDVDDAAVKDLFQSTVGPTRECYLAYDKNGKHKGVATVVFQKHGDAQKAHKSYNNRLIDGR